MKLNEITLLVVLGVLLVVKCYFLYSTNKEKNKDLEKYGKLEGLTFLTFTLIMYSLYLIVSEL